MPTALKALLAQFAGLLLAFVLARGGALPPGIWPLIAAQALGAVAAAALLRAERWWLAIHLGFTPLLAAALQLGLAPGWSLTIFVALVLVYWTTFRTRVPLYFTNRATAQALAGLLPAGGTPALLDVGAGTGALLRTLATLRPDGRYTGVECAPAPWLIGRLAARGGIDWRHGDLFALPWEAYDVVYAFLSPAPMAAVWRKAAAELRPGSVLVSNSFAVPGREPDAVIDVADRRRTRLLLYRAPLNDTSRQAPN